MRSIFALAVLLFSLGPAQGSAQTADKTAEELIAVEHAWADAIQKRDAAALGRIMADEMVSTSPEGAVTTKAQDLANFAADTNKIETFVVDDMKVQTHGQTAVVTGRATIKGQATGIAPGVYRFTDTFVTRDGRWQCVATQATAVAPSVGASPR
jgi:ketosteroid isomerase-like protein